MSRPPRRNLARTDRAQVQEGVRQFGLPVAFDARDADDFARANAEADVGQLAPAAFVLHRQPLDLKHDLAGLSGVSRHAQHDVAPDHALGEIALGRIRHIERFDHPAAAHDGDPVRDGGDLAQLMGDDHNRTSLGAQRAQRREQTVALDRAQNGGRLVEYENPRVAIQQFQDFDPLLDTDRQAIDPR